MQHSNLFRGLTLVLALSFSSHVLAQTSDELMAKGDAHDARLEAQTALNFYLPALQMEPKSVPLMVRIARQYRHLMTDARSKEDKVRLGQTALGYAQRAAALGPRDAEAQLSPAITYGKMLPYLGSKEQVEGSQHIKDAVDKALKLDPRNDVAWHVLGRWHQVIANIGLVKRTLGRLLYASLPTSTNEEAIKCFNKAIALNPRSLRHHIELGRTYAQMGRNEEARLHIQKGLAMPSVEKDDPELKAKGRETLEKLP